MLHKIQVLSSLYLASSRWHNTSMPKQQELPKTYDPKTTEQKIYDLWLKSGFFNPDKLPKRHKKPFCITIPPPNVTGELHMGHTLQHIIHDISIRKKRMEGYKTLWLPGTDHAGIATQNKVEQKLKKEGKTRFDLGREKFNEEVWKWKEQYGNIILDQMKKLGNSCDWSRARFTMDEEYAKAVNEAFTHYYDKGWIYRGLRVVNWCTRCGTSLSDLEVEYKEEQGKLWYVRYPLKINNKNEKIKTTDKNLKIPDYITVATTRPETMLGDAAVAVNPKDERYKNLLEQIAILPIQNREIPIIADDAVDPKFGTGAVKVTPLHDFNDWEIAQRHNLKQYKIIDERGRMTKEAGPICDGLKPDECRDKVLEELKNQKLIEKGEDFIHQLPRCYRCNTIIQPLANIQWFLKMDELAKIAIKAVKSGDVRFTPKRWEKLYFDWLKNIKDWCISRQLWWGHRLPVWFCGDPHRPLKKMGFDEEVIPQVFMGKTKTYRLRDHGFKVGDKVLFENSQAKTYFGYGIITAVEKTRINEIDYKDKTHYKIYKNVKELLGAFKLRNPEKTVTPQSEAYLYAYKFRGFTKENSEEGCGQISVSANAPAHCPSCSGKNLRCSEDVLDTWFSSSLWPFAALGWPNKNAKDLKTFYPTDILITDRGIINLWVARMIFSSYEFLGKKPFSEVIVHATVLAKDGQRMSKSLGTGVDPIGLIDKHGADATRFGMIYQAMGGQDIRFTEDHIVAGRKFCNKLWNINRFVIMQMTNDQTPMTSQTPSPNAQTPSDKKILARLKKTVKIVDTYIENYQFGQAAHALYNFVWHDFADVYIEENKKQKDAGVLLYVLTETLKLLHPFIPFITEEIYQTLPLKKKLLLLIERWPSK